VLCRDRGVSSVPTPVVLEKLGLFQAPSGLQKSDISSRKEELARVFDLSFLYLPRVYAVSLRNDNKGTWLIASLRDGRILSKRLLSKRKKDSQWFKTLDPSGVSHYDLRVSKLSLVLHEIAERGFSNKAYKAFKRLNLVAFTTSIQNLLGVVRQILSNLPKRSSKTRHPSVRPRRLLSKPSFTGETKSRRNPGLFIPVWDFRPIVKLEQATGNSDDGWG